MKHILGFLITLLLLGCSSLPQQVGLPRGTPRPLATTTASRAALATVTSAPTFTAVAPSATPDPTLLPEQYVSEGGVLSFRFPVEWELRDRSDASATIITVEAPAGSESRSRFIVNAQNAGAALTKATLYEVAEEYLRSLFGEAAGDMPVSYREEGNALLATVITEIDGEPLQFEVRFLSYPPFSLVLTLIAPPERWDVAAPLLDAMARSISVNPAAASIVSTPTAAVARQSEGLSIQNASLYRASTGSLYFVGEAVNSSGQVYEAVQVTVALTGPDGAELAHATWPVLRRLLPPDERAPALVIFDTPPQGWSGHQVSVSAVPADFALRHVTSEFEAINVAATEPALGVYVLSGQIRNPGPDARFVEVTGVLYDAAGQVLAVESYSLEQDTLSTGEDSPFALTFYSKAEGEIARHEVIVEGLRVGNQGN
ncbi:MAG: hypothetical protein ACRDIB_12045 [Ardenticatenaceae bacterium]